MAEIIHHEQGTTRYKLISKHISQGEEVEIWFAQNLNSSKLRCVIKEVSTGPLTRSMFDCNTFNRAVGFSAQEMEQLMAGKGDVAPETWVEHFFNREGTYVAFVDLIDYAFQCGIEPLIYSYASTDVQECCLL